MSSDLAMNRQSQEESALIGAIRANRTDDVTRQIYADWLEERGDSRSLFLRAELAFVGTSFFSPQSAGKQMMNELFNCEVPSDWIDEIGLRFNLQVCNVESAVVLRLGQLFAGHTVLDSVNNEPIEPAIETRTLYSRWRNPSRASPNRSVIVVCNYNLLDAFLAINQLIRIPYNQGVQHQLGHDILFLRAESVPIVD